MEKPMILITNDDGIAAKGIRSLVAVMKKFGNVVVVAPDKPQSGMGHAITINQPLRLNKSDIFGDIQAFSCTGTPVDCVKLGIYEVLKRKPDLLVSGINHGENTSTNVLYSGTMSAAVEGAMEGIPSIGFSLCDFDAEADFSACEKIIEKIIEKCFDRLIPEGICYNINFPKLPFESIKGIKVVRQALAYWEDKFDKRIDQFGKPYYWLTGDFGNHDPGENTDLDAIKNGYVTIVPTQYDLTATKQMKEVENIFK
ncbi:MAG: 5'/3'-nucleotidase SurE [Flavobacteriia bacterium]|nr:5'/3'-nucleotidase SurE [Flavobacteriia bacterium]